MKQKVAILIVFCLIIVMGAIPSNAYQQESISGTSVLPYFKFITSFATYFTINDSGEAEVDVLLYAEDVPYTRVFVTLERKVNGEWESVTGWTKGEDGELCGLSKSYEVEQGYAYRVVAVGFTYNERMLPTECTSITTKTKYYY